VLAQLGLTSAIRDLLRQFQNRTELAVEADLEDVGKPESQSLLYRAARELLTNIGKHAGAPTVRVGLLRRGDRIVLTIGDDGTGFDPQIVSRYVADGHIGLGSLLALRRDGRIDGHRLAEGLRHPDHGDVAPEPVTSSGELGAPPREQT
jgi:two-component system, NarL family, sensor kinase